MDMHLKYGSKASLFLIIILATLTAGGCATTNHAGNGHDPLEGPNRAFFDFNESLDKNFFRPVVKSYIEYTPQPLQNGISNFFDNLTYLNVALNEFLQGKLAHGVSDIARFLVNSTLGLGGLVDVATGMGMEEHDEDLGQTFGAWGAGEGSYLVIPLIGPNSIRDVPDQIISAFLNPLFYLEIGPAAIPLGVLGAIDKRARLENAVRIRDSAALDPYIFTREAYRQRRTYLIYDGNPPVSQFDELDLELDLELDGRESRPQ